MGTKVTFNEITKVIEISGAKTIIYELESGKIVIESELDKLVKSNKVQEIPQKTVKKGKRFYKNILQESTKKKEVIPTVEQVDKESNNQDVEK